MTTQMLIDARHPEETRVSVVTNGRLNEFDYETSSKVQIKGNIYLAKVTRVEPSLQAAFIEYGGNRQGFLAFSEIHPDYFQIPIEDREALLAEEAKKRSEEAQMVEAAPSPMPSAEEITQEPSEGVSGADEESVTPKKETEEFSEESLARRRRAQVFKRRYRIQEVIKKRQVILVQVVKEERGTKGAAMTTYLSLPGRYCVLMPNTTNGHGISRKIADGQERQRLRKILEEIKIPEGMGAIIRTVGQERTKVEIKRDLDYLMNTWEKIREQTLKASAPALIFEEGNLIKRSLRDLYDKHVDEVLVEGKTGFESARDYMKQLMPTHAKKIKLYHDKTPLFHKFGVEEQIESLFVPIIHLRSGGYIVISPTEALVSIDVNSGRATREHNIEETALQTNIEAAEEIARQLRLRDIAGLIVIDFIDMEHFSNNKTIEKRFRDALRADRARIFTSRISQLGLLEMSRQRMRSSLYEISTQPCPHCQGSGRIASTDTLALRLLRQAEDLALKGGAGHILIQAPQELSLYLLNTKRKTLEEMESRYSVKLFVAPSSHLRTPNFSIRSLSQEEIQREIESGSAVANTMATSGAGAMGQRAPRPTGFGRSDRGHYHNQGRRRGRRGGRRHGYQDQGFSPAASSHSERDLSTPDNQISGQGAESSMPSNLADQSTNVLPTTINAAPNQEEPKKRSAGTKSSGPRGHERHAKSTAPKKEDGDSKGTKSGETKKRSSTPRKGWWQRATGK